MTRWSWRTAGARTAPRAARSTRTLGRSGQLILIPKTATRLMVGDYCLVPRADGRFAPLIVVGKSPNTRSAFFGALARVVLQSSCEPLPDVLRLGQHALLQVSCFREHNMPLVGNVLDRIDELTLRRIASDIKGSGVGHTVRVWGNRAVLYHANQVAA